MMTRNERTSVSGSALRERRNASGKKKLPGKFCRLLSLVLIVFLLAGQTVYAAVPKMDAPATAENAISLMDAYDQDAAYILRTQAENGDNLAFWMTGGSLTEGIDTTVHEEFHAYSHNGFMFSGQKIYIGNQKVITVPYTKVFPSKKMAAEIPSRLRTMRWETYVGHPRKNMDSDKNGVYGLLNEFSAYYWGMHAQMSLYEYYKNSHATPEQWRQFINNCANDRLAYAEFRYYTEKYLVYAKKHNKAVYKGIKKNKDYIRAYTTIERNFAALIDEFEQHLQDIAVILEQDGHRVKVGDPYWIDRLGFGIFQDDYDNLMKELSKPKYKKAVPKL